MVKSQNHLRLLSPRTINSNPRFAGMKRHDLDSIKQVKASEASSDRRESLDEVEAYLATDGICTNDLFGSPKIQQPSESGDATDTPEAMHQKPSLQRTSIRTQSQRLVYQMRMAANVLHLNQMERLWTRCSVRVR